MHKHMEKDAGFKNPVARKLHQPMTLYNKIAKKKSRIAWIKKLPRDREVQS